MLLPICSPAQGSLLFAGRCGRWAGGRWAAGLPAGCVWKHARPTPASPAAAGCPTAQSGAAGPPASHRSTWTPQPATLGAHHVRSLKSTLLECEAGTDAARGVYSVAWSARARRQYKCRLAQPAHPFWARLQPLRVHPGLRLTLHFAGCCCCCCCCSLPVPAAQMYEALPARLASPTSPARSMSSSTCRAVASARLSSIGASISWDTTPSGRPFRL